MSKSFEAYFQGKPLLTGAQSSSGDDFLVLRAGSVLRANLTWNKAFASVNHNANFMTITAQSTWYKIEGIGMADQMSTASFTFENDGYTYVGPDQIYPATISVSITMSKLYTGNGGEEYEIGIFVNGNLKQSTMSATVHEDDTQPFKANITSLVGHILTTGDVIDIRVLNRSGTDDVKIEDVQLVIDQ